MSGYMQIIDANDKASAFELGADIPIVEGRGIIS